MPDFIRNAIDRIKSAWASGRDRVGDYMSAGNGDEDSVLKRPWVKWLSAFLVFLIVVYYPVGMLLYHTIDDSMDFQPPAEFVVEGGSKAVSTAAALMSREIEHWAPNKPLWMPAAALDNMPNFQLGMVYAIGRFAAEMGDYLGRVRGSSAIDPNLDRAAGLLRYDGRVWYWGQGNILPMRTSEAQYRQAIDELMTYNRGVAANTATFERRADNLIAFLDRVAADMGSASAALDARAGESDAGYFDMRADDLFYDVKGRLYVYHLLLRDLGEDFAVVLKEKQAGEIWNNMQASLATAAAMDPLMIANGSQDGMLIPSHLSSLGFYLLRARTQIREVTDALIK